ncbi:MAG: type II toxin-antitoxin system death-on-curing family toxin [Gammaproteobacteria bacterium]|nr:type II toxin-antitoxin system death-on-curing family toxin [Gammaproteobacteria bacterium]
MSDQGPGAWVWVKPSAVFAVHDRQIAEHGGLDGIRNRGAIESALARPVNLANCGVPDWADLAAAYAYGLAMNHGFSDGNKRTAWVTARLFLAQNGVSLEFEALEAVQVMERMAAGKVGERELAEWFRARGSG